MVVRGRRRHRGQHCELAQLSIQDLLCDGTWLRSDLHVPCARGLERAAETLPTTSSLVLLYVASCASPASCLAITGVGGVAPSEAALYWNGQVWKAVSDPVQSAGWQLDPLSLSCPYEGTSEFCVLINEPNASGYSPTQVPDTALIWRGGGWLVQGTIQGGWNVGRRGGDDCLVLGAPDASPGNTTTLYSWQGHEWSSQVIPGGAIQYDQSDPLQCVGDDICFMGGDLIGDGVSSSTQASQLLEWNGSSWLVVGSALTSTNSAAGLAENLVSCAPDDYCLDIGSAGTFALP